uniref:Uncharacterized protein n=1 Tax=Arundo donax TaxID=35708 RepID=A0A0A9EYN6_ARUDO
MRRNVYRLQHEMKNEHHLLDPQINLGLPTYIIDYNLLASIRM